MPGIQRRRGLPPRPDLLSRDSAGKMLSTKYGTFGRTAVGTGQRRRVVAPPMNGWRRFPHFRELEGRGVDGDFDESRGWQMCCPPPSSAGSPPGASSGKFFFVEAFSLQNRCARDGATIRIDARIEGMIEDSSSAVRQSTSSKSAVTGTPPNKNGAPRSTSRSVGLPAEQFRGGISAPILNCGADLSPHPLPECPTRTTGTPRSRTTPSSATAAAPHGSRFPGRSRDAHG